ncbi:hypothetical protein [Cytophaga aurantiaca]|uniref:hypothetical protein n=1 Tax=Cytophaga aurantiaca TaxID=29530 RepID=UPI0003818BD6|nr:hypothetical protein [Cytophaga aurantiaca]
MKNILRYFLFVLIITACSKKNSLKELEKFQTTSLLITLTINDTIADKDNIDKNFRISTFYKGEKLSFYPSNEKITLPIFDTIPEFDIEYEDLRTEFKGDMPKYEGKHIFTKKASKINLIVDTHPFDSTSISKFRNRTLTPKNYFMFIETNSMGWNWRALEEK